MTKHLRLIMLSLLAMICMGGYSAVGDTYKLVTSVDELHDGDVIVIGASQQGYAMGPVNSISSNNRLGKKVDIVDGVLKFADGVAELTLKACTDNKWQFHSNEGYLYAAGANKDKQNYLRSDEAITGEQSIATIAFEGNNATITFGGNAKSKIIRYNHSVNNKTQEITSLFSCYSSGQNDIQIYKKQGSGLTSTSTTFGTDYDGKTFEFVNGVLKGWKTPTATHTPADVTGKIKYTSDNVPVADVDQDGQLTFSGYGTATITVTFTPDDTKTYAESTASYKVINKDPNAPVDVVFVASVDKGKTTVIGKDEMSKNGVSIQSENAALGNGEIYRFYQEIKVGHTFSVKRGFITKIVFEGGTSSYSLKNVTLKDQKNGAITTSSVNKATWEGEAKSVVFTTSGQARATKITVTVKLPVAKDYTLDEEDINVIEDYDNANVTLTRTFYHDNAWNTLCLPFDVDANKVATAFADAEIREIDLSKCTGNTIQFVPATEIKAGVPYIIKWNENVAEAKPFEETFDGVMLVAEPKPVKVNNDITFTGFYKMTAASELGGTSVAAIGAGSKLFTVGEGKMKGFRAAFVLSSNAQASKYKVVIDGTATGIEDLVIDSAKANGRVYNLNGQYVGNSLNGLLPGLYIQNGKKIVVK